MARKTDITLAKGAVSVSIFTVSDAENFKNILTIIPGIVSPNNQSGGNKVPSVVDLLRITHTLQFEGYIVETTSTSAKTTKDNLISIFNGASVDSTPIVLTYEDASINVFFEDFTISPSRLLGVIDQKHYLDILDTIH